MCSPLSGFQRASTHILHYHEPRYQTKTVPQDQGKKQVVDKTMFATLGGPHESALLLPLDDY